MPASQSSVRDSVAGIRAASLPTSSHDALAITAHARAVFGDKGYALEVKPLPVFHACEARWRDAQGELLGAVVGPSEEAACTGALRCLAGEPVTG